MAIKFSQFNERTDHTSGMYLVGYDGNQNIHITVDNLFDDFINGTENTIAMFGTDGTVLADSILSQDVGATILTVSGQLNVDADATFDTSITVTGDSTLNGNVTLGNAGADLITQTGTLYLNGPVKDTTDTLGVVDQVLLSDAAGELTFTDLADLHVGGAEVVELPVKNVQGSALVKGDPVYISGSVGASGRLEVQLADASNTLKMPAVGLLKQDLANNAQGFVVVTGKLRNLITDPIDGVNPTENDVIYIKPSGTSGAALTTTKPVYGNFIQNIGKVGRVSTSNDGNFVVSSILRTNDIPNLTPGRLWIGSTGNTIESQTIFVDEATGEVGIGTASPSYTADVAGTFRTAGQAIFAELGPVSVAQLGGGSSTTSQFNIISTAGGGSFIAATNRLVFKANNKDAIKINNAGQLQFGEYGSGTFTGTSVYNLSLDFFGNIIETAPVPADIVETITTTDGTYINLTPNSATDGDVTITADLSAVDGASDATTKFLSKDNTWDVPFYTTVTTTDGTFIDLTPNAATSGAVTVTADLSATGAPDATKYLRGDNTWSAISGIYSWDISDGANNETIINGDTVTFSGDTYITTTYTAGNNTLSIDHDDTSRTDTASADSPGYGGTFTVVDSVSTNATGHLEAINVKTVTMPSADDTNTTYDLSGYGTNNGTAGVQLVGSDSSTDQVAITGAGTTSVTHSGNTITVTSNDQYTGTVTGSGTAGITGGQIPYWDATTNITGTSQLNYSIVAGVGVVGIGNSSTSFGASRLIVGSGSGNSLMTLYGGSNNTNTIAFANGTSGNAEYRGQVRYNQQNDNLEFLTNGETFSRVYVDSASDLNLIERTLNFRNSFPYAVGAYVDLPTDNQLSIGTNGSERMRINSAGSVGIGTTSPAQKLDVNGNLAISGTTFVDSTRRNIYLNSFAGGGANGIFFRDGFTYNASITAEDHSGSGADGICISGYDGVSFSTGSNTKNERMRIGSAGQIGIGGANYGTSGQVLTSSGSSSAPSWQTPTAGGITGVTAGSYMTGGGTSGTVTLNANASTSATGSTLAARDGSGDITARLFRATYGNQSTISGAIAFRVNNSSDTYTRYCSNPTAIRTFIGAGTSSFSGSYNDLSNKPTIPTNNNQLTNGAGYITSSGVAAKIKAGGNGPSTENLNTVANSVSVGQLEYRGFSLASSNAPAVSDNANGVITVGQHSGNYNAQVAFSSNGNIYWRDNPSSSFGSWRKMWDEGNDGAGSGLDADLLDGLHATASGNRWGVVPTVGSSGVLEAGKYIDFHDSDSHTGDYNYRISSSPGRLYLSGDLEVDGGDIYINDTNTRITEGSNNSIRLQTNSGYVDVGPQNSSYAHFSTDRGAFYFNKEVQVDTGIIRSHNEDLNLNRAGSSTARLRVTSGTTYSDQLFYVSTTGTALRAQSSQGEGAIIRGGNNSTNIATFQNSSGSTEVIINTNGYIGVQRTTASYPIDVTGDISASLKLRLGTYGAFLSTYYSYITTNSEFRVGYGGGSYARCRASAFTVTSDYRLKENIEPLKNPIDRLKQLKVYRFNWKDKLDEDKVDGFIAHEVSDVIPEAVAGEKDEINQDGEPEHQGLDQAKIVPLLTSALQEAILKIEQLETRIQTLENN